MKSTDVVPPKTEWLLAYLLLDRLDGAQVCEWAVSALEAGFDTEALRMLGGMSLQGDPTLYEAKPYLAKALQELGIPEPRNRESVLRAYARNVATELVSGEIGAQKALDDIHSVVVDSLNHPADLMGWCYLWEGNAPDGSCAEVSEQEFELEARAFAQSWLMRSPSNAT